MKQILILIFGALMLYSCQPDSTVIPNNGEEGVSIEQRWPCWVRCGSIQLNSATATPTISTTELRVNGTPYTMNSLLVFQGAACCQVPFANTIQDYLHSITGICYDVWVDVTSNAGVTDIYVYVEGPNAASHLAIQINGQTLGSPSTWSLGIGDTTCRPQSYQAVTCNAQTCSNPPPN